jgi:DNA topoisomerase I
MSKLDEREYVTHDKRALIPTELGIVLIDLVEGTAAKLKKDNGTDLFDTGFTAGMEEKLDRVETGEVEWHRMMQEFYPDLQHWIELARETADPDQVALLLEALTHVKKWEPPVKRGRRTYDDAETVADLRKEVAEGRRLTAAQGRMLHALACRYMEQIPSELAQALQLETPAAPRDETAGKLAMFEGVAFDEPRKVGQRVYDDGKFVRSIQRQVESRKRLSEKQVAALDRLLLKYADRISNFEERREKLGIREPEKQEADPYTAPILDLLVGIQTWNPPKGKFDDRAFYDSLRSQFESRGALSPRQLAALKKMVQRYASQIPDYAAKAEAFGLPPPRQG